MATLHQDIANFVAEDGKRSWTGQQLHEDLRGLERRWSESAIAPTKQASRLTESYKKALRVTKALGETAVKFKRRLSEALRQNGEAGTLIEELTQRGQAWVALADKRKDQIAELNHQLNTSCEALEIMAGRYHEDTTTLGKRLIILEFKEKAETEDIQKMLKEAKHPNDILKIREKLEPPKPKEEKKEEAKGDGKKPEEKKVLTEKKEEQQFPTVLVPSVRTISESADMVKRLSAANAR